MALTGLAIAAALGLAKSELLDRPKEERQRKLAARTQELNPWTGMQAQKIQEADPFGSALKYGAVGAQIGQNDEALKAAKDNPWGTKFSYNISSGGGAGDGLSTAENRSLEDYFSGRRPT